MLLYHIYTNKLSFFFNRKSLDLCTCERRQRYQTFKTCYSEIKAEINTCMYKIKSGGKTQALEMYFLMLAE